MTPSLSVALHGGGRVLSIQSHTVQGYVGNKAAVFPLQLLGFDVDPLNSVQLSNHTGYPTWKGQILDGEQLWALIEGLEANGLLFYSHLLTGYIGSLSFLETVLRVVDKLRSVNPNLIYVCDPVMGDDGRLYIRPELVPIYRHQVVPVATLITPNQFEAEQLTGLSIRTQADAITACDMLHSAGPRKVVITSMEVDGRLLVVGSDTSSPAVEQEGSTPSGPSSSSGPHSLRRFCIAVPKIPQYFTGTGDLMTALLLGWSHKYPHDLARAAELAVASLQAVLARTLHHRSPPLDSTESSLTPPTPKRLELCLVQSRDDIISPPVVLRAQAVESGVDGLDGLQDGESALRSSDSVGVLQDEGVDAQLTTES